MGHTPSSRRLHSERPILPLKGEAQDCLGVGQLGNPESGLPCVGRGSECLGDQAWEGALRHFPGSARTPALTAAAGCCALASLTPGTQGWEALLAWLRGPTTDSEGSPDTWVP